MFTIWVYLAVFIIQSQFEAFLYLTQLFLFDQRIPQGASSPYQEKLTTFPLTQVKNIILLLKTIIRVDLLTRCLNEIWILSFWIYIWKIFGSLNWFFKLCYLPINCSKFSSCFFFSSWKRSIWLAAYQFSQSNFKFALLFLYIIKFITWKFKLMSPFVIDYSWKLTQTLCFVTDLSFEYFNLSQVLFLFFSILMNKCNFIDKSFTHGYPTRQMFFSNSTCDSGNMLNLVLKIKYALGQKFLNLHRCSN